MWFAMELKFGWIPRLACVPPLENPDCRAAFWVARFDQAFPTSPGEIGASVVAKALTFGRLVMKRSARNPGYRSGKTPNPPRITVLPGFVKCELGVHAKPIRGPQASVCMSGKAWCNPVTTAWLYGIVTSWFRSWNCVARREKQLAAQVSGELRSSRSAIVSVRLCETLYSSL